MSYQNRACLRISTSFEAFIANPAGGTLPVKISNVSVTGFQLSSSISFKKNDILFVQIKLPKMKETFELRVEILRTRVLSEDKNGYVCAMGAQILNLSEEWTQHAGRWIESSFEKTTDRKIAAFLLCVPALAFMIKAMLTALGLQTFKIHLNEFFGLGFLGVPIFPGMFPVCTLFLACMLFYCAWTVLHPSLRSGFLFTSRAAMIGVVFFSVRLFVKFSLLHHALDQKLIYLADLIVSISGYIGVFMSWKLEDRRRPYGSMISSENIYPPASSSSKTQND